MGFLFFAIWVCDSTWGPFGQWGSANKMLPKTAHLFLVIKSCIVSLSFLRVMFMLKSFITSCYMLFAMPINLEKILSVKHHFGCIKSLRFTLCIHKLCVGDVYFTHPPEASIQYHTPSPNLEPTGEEKERPAPQQLEARH